ncbi:hypothetical protein [Rhodanobacter sp. C01]|uniref:hypothetical protein n=1 Tax=Rhodanobacter sp. C01 TaxID=1945856 RepID=UPI000985F99A|nr:hypothetical protein [Rhodanobacter sp. C01]OOG50918.1 hypothetical protein B0E50_01615 [Rhodanobacter sp. C01]
MVVYTLKQADDGQWSICRLGMPLFTQMQLSPAIKLAREVARDEHHRNGQPTSVEMRGLGSLMRLAHFDRAAGTTAA